MRERSGYICAEIFLHYAKLQKDFKHMKMNIILIVMLFSTYALSQSVSYNFEESISLAKEIDGNVLMVFSGSDWCKPCIHFKQSVLESDEFKSYAQDKMVVLELDFPYKKKNKLDKEQLQHNERMAEKYNIEGSFPKILLFDVDSKLLGHLEYKKNMLVSEFIDSLNETTK